MNQKLKNVFLLNGLMEEDINKFGKALEGLGDEIQNHLADLLEQNKEQAQTLGEILKMKIKAIDAGDQKMLDEVLEMEKKFIETIDNAEK